MIVATGYEESDTPQLDLLSNNKRRAVGHSSAFAELLMINSVLV